MKQNVHIRMGGEIDNFRRQTSEWIFDEDITKSNAIIPAPNINKSIWYLDLSVQTAF